MHRRDLFRILAAGAALPALSPNALAMIREAQSTQNREPKTLNAHQDATVTVMAERIIPETDTPGAKGAKVNEFIDVILTDWATTKERQQFLDGVASVDEQSNKLYGKNFVDCAAPQQESLLRSLDEQWVSEELLPKPHLTGYQKRDQQLQGNFFGTFKRITLYGYYTSEIGFTQELKKVIIPGSYHGCIPVSEPRKT
jgi:hypothetical protein